jgi:thymidine phosphorylase
VGETVGPDAPLACIHARDESGFFAAEKRLQDAYIISPDPTAPLPVSLERIT